MVVLVWQSIDKPGSVLDDHLSRQIVAYLFERISTRRRAVLCTDLLAANRVYLHSASPRSAVSSCLTRFTLTLAGGFVSVALSLGLLPVAVSDCYALCCPDFPPR